MASYKHADPVHLKFGETGDSSLLRKKNHYAEGGMVGDATWDPGPVPGPSTSQGTSQRSSQGTSQQNALNIATKRAGSLRHATQSHPTKVTKSYRYVGAGFPWEEVTDTDYGASDSDDSSSFDNADSSGSSQGTSQQSSQGTSQQSSRGPWGKGPSQE